MNLTAHEDEVVHEEEEAAVMPISSEKHSVREVPVAHDETRATQSCVTALLILVWEIRKTRGIVGDGDVVWAGIRRELIGSMRLRTDGCR